MLVTSVVVTLGADRGALLVFGHGVGVDDAAATSHDAPGHGESGAGAAGHAH